MTDAPLGHLTVVDLTRYHAGPYCTRLLAGYGARVIKVEAPDSGDPLRQCGPFVKNKPGNERSIPFHWLNAGKESITLDLKTNKGREIITALIREADVLVENFAPRVMPSLGLDYDKVRELNPRLVMTSISNFGHDGPYRDYRANESVMYAMSGGMVATGDPDRPPLASGPAITQYTAGLHAYIATLMAVWRRTRTDHGEHVEVSIQESALENIEIHLTEYAHKGKVARRDGDEHPLVPWRCYPCSDGYAAVIGGPIRHWRKAADLFEEPRLGAPELRHMGDRIARRREVEAMIRPWLERHDKKDIYHKGQAIGLAFGYVASLAEALESPQHRAREFFQETEPHPEVGRLQQCGPPFRITSGTWRVGRAPLLGEHNGTVLSDLLGYSLDDVARFSAEGAI